MIPHSAPLKRYARIKPKKRPQVRVGKVSGCVRLSGKALQELRMKCHFRDEGICQECGTYAFLTADDGHPYKYDMAHILSRGAGGSDTLDNVRTLCHACHMREHTKGLKG